MLRDEQDRVLKFLTGLNDTFTATRGQILMMDPKPSITRVFNLISQEERQRSMKNTNATSAVAFQTSQATTPQSDSVVAVYSGGYNRQKNRHMCSHCGIAGHTVNRCYKLHGYPPGYKPPYNSSKPQQQSGNANNNSKKENAANMMIEAQSHSMSNQQGVNLDNLTSDQVRQILGVLNMKPNHISQISSSQLTLSDGSVSISKPQPQLTTQIQASPSNSSKTFHLLFAGIINGLNTRSGSWVVDTGASCHVCSDPLLFTNLEPIHNTSVTLPNGTIISVSQSGSVPISDTLVLRSVLFVPHFQFNLLSISALTKNSNITVLFSCDSCYTLPYNPFLS